MRACIKADRADSDVGVKGGWGYFCFLSFHGEGIRGQTERVDENIPDILSLIDGKSLMQTGYKDMHQN